MSRVIYIGIDNGVSGSLGVVDDVGNALMQKMPTFKELNYTKRKRNITRVDWKKLNRLLKNTIILHPEAICKVFLERPMVNPGRFQATASALRALEATLISLNKFYLPIRYVDSREWQEEMLPKCSGHANLKKESRDIGLRIFPKCRRAIKEHKDSDGLLIAEWARRHNL
jgi:hypothetical protein